MIVVPLRVPASVKVCGPATAVSVTFCPSTVPVTGADPLLHKVGVAFEPCGGSEIEYTTLPVIVVRVGCKRNPPCSPPMKESSAGAAIVNCQLPASWLEVACDAGSEFPPQAERIVSTATSNVALTRRQQSAPIAARVLFLPWMYFLPLITFRGSRIKIRTSSRTEQCAGNARRVGAGTTPPLRNPLLRSLEIRRSKPGPHSN